MAARFFMQKPLFSVFFFLVLVGIGSNDLHSFADEQQTAKPQEEKAAEKTPQDPRIGKSVIVTSAGAELRTPEAVVWRAYIGDVYTVSLTNDQWLWIAEKGGWLWQNHVLMLDEGVDVMSSRIAADPSAENYNLRGIVFSAHQKYDKAIADFTTSLARKKNNAGVLNNRGQAKYKKGDLSAAIVDFTAAIRADSKHYVALNNRALCHMDNEDFKAALKDLNSAIKLHEEYPEALNNRGIIHSRNGDYKAAIADFTAAIKVDERYTDAYGNRAFAHRRQKQFKKALTDLRTAIEKSPLQFEPVNDLAWMLATTNEPSVRDGKEAVELATRACQMTQYQNWNTIDTLAAAYAAAGDFKSAGQWIATALEKAPEDEKSDLEKHSKLIESKKTIDE